MTSSLFATTVFACFFVVALPHILPCPASRVAYADGEMLAEGSGKRRRRRKLEIAEARDASIVEFGSGSGDDEQLRSSARTKRECPVPKPGGVVGELLGFRKSANDEHTTTTSDVRPTTDK